MQEGGAGLGKGCVIDFGGRWWRETEPAGAARKGGLCSPRGILVGNQTCLPDFHFLWEVSWNCMPHCPGACSPSSLQDWSGHSWFLC